jgi:hypothetical protein
MAIKIGSPLLSLPAELRLAIYDFAIPDIPLHHHRSRYVGLVNTCRLMRTEAEPIILKRICATLWSEIRS